MFLLKENIYLYVAVYLCFTIYDFRFSLIPLFTRVITIKNDEIFILMIQSILHLILIIVIVILSIIKPLTSGYAWWLSWFVYTYWWFWEAICFCTNFGINKLSGIASEAVKRQWMKVMKYLAILKEWYMYEHKTIWFVIYSEWIYTEVVFLHYDIKHLFISIF